MGAWGTAIFSDDLACDARDGFRELIAEGYSSDDATARLVAAQQFSETDDDGGAQWLGLAVTQWKTGRLLDSVRDRALAVIAAESAALWTSPDDWKKRQKVLEQTREMLQTPQRAPAKIKREPVPESPFAAGDVVRFTLDSGREVALWALTRTERTSLVRTSVENAFALIAFGDPALEAVEQLAARRPPLVQYASGQCSFIQLHLWLPQDAREPRWAVIGNVPVPAARQSPRQFQMPLNLRRRPGKPDEIANAAFSRYYEQTLGLEPSPVTAAQIALGEQLPGGVSALWNSHFASVPLEVALELGDRIASGDTETGRGALALADRQLADSAATRRVGLELIDRLLCIASHPEAGLERDRLLTLLGPQATALVTDIDTAWNGAGGAGRWQNLDHPLSQARRRSHACCRRLADDRYLVWDSKNPSPAADL